MLPSWFAYIAAAISTIGGFLYIGATLKGQTKPNRVTWSMWALAPILSFFLQMQQHVGAPAATTLMYGVMPLIILIVSFFVPESVWKITVWDSLCGIIALIGIGIWYFTPHPLVALVAEVIADVVAGLPTLWKSWRHPESEIWVSYLVGGSSAVLTMLAIHHFTLSAWLFPAAIVAMNFLIVVGVVRGNRRPRVGSVSAAAGSLAK